MEENKLNDLFLTMIANPNNSVLDLFTVGLDLNNTSLRNKEDYKNLDIVQETFKDENGFNEDLFNQTYNAAMHIYNDMAIKDYEKEFAETLKAGKYDIFANPSKRETDPGFELVKIANPYRVTHSMEVLGLIGERQSSIDEIAQTQKVLTNPKEVYDEEGNADWTKAIWHESPNDSFFTDFWDTRVMAAWDEDGVHKDPITGELTQHNAGDLKLNENGTFYYENLDGRNVHGKRVLNKMNTFTVDGSAWNKYDFFDSDDLEQKSFGGAVMRNLALVGTMFIPYVGPAIAALSIALQSTKLFATLGKMLVGSDSPTLSAIEGFATSIDRHNASEYAQLHTWCMENMINLIGDVAAQLKEQRFIFEYAPVLFTGKHLPVGEKAYLAARKKMVDGWTAELASKSDESIQAWIKLRSLKGLKPRPEELVTQYGKRQVANALDASLNKWDAFEKSYNKIGEVLSKAYMTAITVSDTYGTAKMEGASDEEAMWLTLGYAAAEYALLSTDIGKWVLPELRADRYKNKAIAKALGKVITDKLDNVVEASAKKVTGETKEAFWQKLFNIGKNIARGEYATGSRTLKASLAAAASESVEEVSEEFLADFSKQCFNWVNQMRGDSTLLTAWNNMLDRYGMSLVGGFIGGGIANVGTLFRSFKNLNLMSYESAVQEIVYMARNKKLDEFRKALDKTPIASKHLSFNFTEEGDFEIAREGNDLNTITKKIVTQFLDNIENTLNAEGGMISDDSFLDIQTRNDLRYVALKNSVTAGIYLQEFNSVLTEIAGLKQQNKTLRDNATKGHTDLQKERNSDGEIDKSTEDLISKNEKRIKELQDRKEAMLKGETSAEFMQDAIFEMTDVVSRVFTIPSFVRYVLLVTGKKPGERISPEELSKLLDDYKKYKSSVGKDKIKLGSNLYYALSGTYADVLTKLAKYLETLSKDKTLGNVLTALTADMSLNALINNENGLSFDEDKILDNISSNLTNQYSNTLLTLINAFGTDVDKEDIKAAVKMPLLAKDASAEDVKKATTQAQENGLEAIENIALDNFEQLFTKLLDNTDNLSLQNKVVLINTLNKMLQKISEIENYLVAGEGKIPLNLAYLTGAEINEIKEVTEPKLKSIQDLKQRINEKQEVPIELFIKDFVLSTDMESTSAKLLTDILNKFQMNKKDMSSFLLSDLELNAVQELLTLTDLYEALIEGAKVDNVDVDNPYGLNKTVNELHTKNKNENWIPLAEIDSSLSNVILRDLHMFKSQFKLALQIHNLNRGNKIEAVNETTNNKNHVLFNAMQRWIVTVPDSPEKEKLKNVLETLKIHKALKPDSLRLNVDDRIALEKEQIKLGDAVTEFLSHYKNINDLIKLFENASDLFEIRQSTLTEKTEFLDFHSFAAYLSTRYVFSSSAFNGNYKQLIEKNLLDTDTKKLIPIGGLEFAVEVSLAFILNKDKFNLMLEAYKQAAFNVFKNLNLDDLLKIINNLILGNLPKDLATKELLEFIFSLELPQFLNVTFIEGIAGSGKTSAVFKIIHTYLDTYHKDLLKNSILAHTDDKKATQTAESSGLKTKGISHKQLLNMAIPNLEETLLDKIFINDLGEVDVTVNINEATENLPKIIFVDEIGLLNRFQVLALDKWAVKHGIIIISGGDLVQNTPIQDIPVDKTTELIKNLIPNNTLGISIPVRLSHVMFPASPKLGLSIRTDNQLKTQNSNIVQGLVERVVNNVAFENETVNLQYYEDDTLGLFGDTVVFSRTDTISDLNLLKILHTIDLMLATLKEGQKIGYIYHDEYKKIVVEEDEAGNKTTKEQIVKIKSKLREILELDKYKDKIIIQSETNALGLESQYYILDLNYVNELSAENPHRYYELYVKSLYTGITRSTLGSLIIAPDSKKIKLRSLQNQLPPVNETYTTEGVNRAKQVKMQALEGLSELEIPYVESAKITKPVGKPTSETTLPAAEITGVMNPKYTIGEYVSSSTTTVRIIDIKDNKYKIRNIFTGAEHEFTIDFFEQNFKEINLNLETIISPFNNSNIKGTLTADGKYTVYFTDDGKLFIVSKEYLLNNFENVDEDLEFAILEQLIVSEDGIKGIFKLYGKSIELNAKSDIAKLTNNIITEIPKVQNASNQEGVEEVIDNTEDELEKLHLEDVAKLVSETAELQTTTSELTNLPTETYETTLIQKEKTSILPSIDKFGDLLDWVFTSHNTVELGVPEDALGNLQFDINTPRIDSANGLYKLLLQGNSAVSGLSTKEDYLNFIEQLREIIFKTSNKRELENTLGNNLGLLNVSVIFAIKTSSLENNTAHKAGKSTEEHLYHMRLDEDQDFNPKQQTISIIIKSGDNQVLELPLLGFMNPITFLTSQLNNYPELLNHWNTLNTEYIHDRVIDFIETFEGESKYLKIVNLFKLFNLTQNYIYYINNKLGYEDWTIAKSFSKTGPLIFNRATAQQSADGIVSTANNYLTDEYLEGVQYTTIEEFEQLNPQFLISNIQVVRSAIDGVNIKVGYPFVLISERHDVENSLNNYINQELNPTAQKYVTLVYVIPPKVSLETYLNGVYNFIYKQIKPKKPFGDDFTAFKILATLFKSQEFIDSVNDLYNSKELSNNGLTYAEFLISKIEEIEKLPTREEQNEALRGANSLENWAQWRLQDAKYRLHKLFEGALLKLFYPYNVNTAENVLNENLLTLAQLILAESDVFKDGIFCVTPLVPTEDEHVMLINTEQSDVRPSLFKLPTMSTSQWSGNIFTLINDMFNSMEFNDAGYLKGGDTIDYVYGKLQLKLTKLQYWASNVAKKYNINIDLNLPDIKLFEVIAAELAKVDGVIAINTGNSVIISESEDAKKLKEYIKNTYGDISLKVSKPNNEGEQEVFAGNLSVAIYNAKTNTITVAINTQNTNLKNLTTTQEVNLKDYTDVLNETFVTEDFSTLLEDFGETGVTEMLAENDELDEATINNIVNTLKTLYGSQLDENPNQQCNVNYKL